jgi:hypothetical protein
MGGTEIFAQGLLIVTYLNVSGKISHKYIYIVQARIRDITLGGALFGEGSGKLLGIRKYRTSFLNRN